MRAAFFSNSNIKMYYKCVNCDSLIIDPEQYDRIYEEKKDKMISRLHEKFTRGKTDEDKRKLLDDILQSSPGGITGGSTKNYTGALILEPEVIPFYEEIREFHMYTNMYGGKDEEYRKKPYWVDPADPPLMSVENYKSIEKEVEKFAKNKGLTKEQKKIRGMLKDKNDEEISSILEKLYEEFFDEELKVYGKKIEKSYVGDPEHSTNNSSYQVIFSYPELEIMKIGKCV